ncbi:MAG: formate dehydrogenase accessory sulfurtransferase FdhD [Phycisphaerae bacterium]
MTGSPASRGLLRDVPVRRVGPPRPAGRGAGGASRDVVAVEHRVQLVVNARPLLWINCLPDSLEALAAGFLVSEGVLDGPEAIADVAVAPDLARVEVRGHVDPDRLVTFRERLSITSGCGGGASAGDEALPPSHSDAAFRPEDLLERLSEMAAASALFRDTGAVHLAAATDGESLSAFAEDIGRHNAVDKTIGRCLLQGVPLGERAILTTGRASADIVAKAARAGLPVVVSRGATTSRAIELARLANLTVVGFARRGRMNAYTAPGRLGLAADTQQPGETTP